jgi:hypothetical protein
MITLLLVAVAIAFLFWPKAGVTNPLPKSFSAEDLFLVPPPAAPKQPAAPDARDAIDSLLEVRDRLAATEALDEDSAKAVDVLWLDLLHGSKK